MQPNKEWLYPNYRAYGYTYSHIENLNYVPHMHDGIEGMYLLDGHMTACVGEKEYHLKAGDFCIVYPQQRHSYKTVSRSDVFGFALGTESIPGVLRSRYVDEHALVSPIFRGAKLPPDVRSMIDLMLTDQARQSSPILHIGRLLQIMGMLYDVQQPVSVKQLEQSTEQQVLLYLEQNALQPITLTSAAEALGLSQFQLSRVCNHQIGMGFNAYLKSIRIAAAMRRLAFTNASVADIAASMGFESVRTFNRAFNEEIGLSPTDYRRQHQEKKCLDFKAGSMTGTEAVVPDKPSASPYRSAKPDLTFDR